MATDLLCLRVKLSCLQVKSVASADFCCLRLPERMRTTGPLVLLHGHRKLLIGGQQMQRSCCCRIQCHPVVEEEEDKLPISRFPISYQSNNFWGGSILGVLFVVVIDRVYSLTRDVKTIRRCSRDGQTIKIGPGQCSHLGLVWGMGH